MRESNFSKLVGCMSFIHPLNDTIFNECVTLLDSMDKSNERVNKRLSVKLFRFASSFVPELETNVLLKRTLQAIKESLNLNEVRVLSDFLLAWEGNVPINMFDVYKENKMIHYTASMLSGEVLIDKNSMMDDLIALQSREPERGLNRRIKVYSNPDATARDVFEYWESKNK